MLVPAVAVSVSAVPYTPSSNAYKDFGQENYYLYEVTKGNAAPKADGRITEADGYGDPISTYGYRYKTTADKAAFDFDKGEYVMTSAGDYYVYPTPDSAQEIWSSITTTENDTPYSFIYTYYVVATKFSASSTFYYRNPITGAYSKAYGVTKETFKEYRPMNAKLEYTLQNAKVLTEKPADWEKNYKNYYTKGSAYTYVTGDTAPEFEAGKYYTGEYFTVNQLMTRSALSTSAVGNATSLKNAHVILPEEVKLYARYDDKYLYYAIELKEMEHQKVRYGVDNVYGSTINNDVTHFFSNVSFRSSYRKAVGASTATATAGTALTTYTNGSQTLKAAYVPAILAKFGNPDATTLAEVQFDGKDFSIKHTPYVPKEEEDSSEDDMFGDETEDYTSKNYGTTVYEYRVPWAVVNREYSPDTHSTAVPDVFTIRTDVELESNIGDGAIYLSFTIPRAAYRLPGSIANSTGSFPNDLHVMRFLESTGMEPGTYNFYWRTFTSSAAIWKAERYTTDYYDVSSNKVGGSIVSHFPPIYYTAGQEPAKDYVVPGYEGTAIRVDGSDAQQMRIKISIPETDKEIEQAGVLVAPTEVARRGHLKLGMSAIAYYAEEFPVFYGVLDGNKWINLTENADSYFGSSVTPNDSDSYVTFDQVGGKPSGVYTVYTLNADLENPYGQVTDEETDVTSDVYTMIFTGPNGEGIYDDFDDFFTFYTIRPFIKYADGTVVYGEYEYKSIYYLACWMFRDMLYAYNETVVDSATAADHYNMDMMYNTAAKDASGAVVTDPEGNTIYVPVASMSLSSISVFSGGAENSIYWPERRLELFRWYANRTVSRANGGVAIRIEDYDNYHPDVKALVDGYVELYENVWQQLVKCEQKRYFKLAD